MPSLQDVKVDTKPVEDFRKRRFPGKLELRARCNDESGFTIAQVFMDYNPKTCDADMMERGSQLSPLIGETTVPFCELTIIFDVVETFHEEGK